MASVTPPAVDHLGRQVAGGAHDQPGGGQPDVVGHVGDAEVDNHGVAVEHEHEHVARLEVAVHDVHVVDGLQRAGQPDPQPQQLRRGQRAVLADHGVKAGAGHEAGDDVGLVTVQVSVQHLGDQRVPDPAQRGHLAGQPGARVGVVRDVRAQHLDGHSAPGPVQAEVDDTCDPAAVVKALDGCDAVLHLAAVADVDQVTRDPAHADRVNVRGTQSLLDGVRDAGIQRFVYASTIWVYGDATGPEALDEDTPLALPKHFYTATKIAGEMYTASYGELFELEHSILRFGIPYGPRSRPTAVVAAFTAKALAGQPLTIAGDGTQSRRFVYVEDLADGVVASLAPAGANRIFNLVGHENTSVRAIARAVRDVVGDVPIVHVEGRAGDLRGGNISGERAARELGWEATTAFADGVRRYIEWVTDDADTPRVATASMTDGSAAAVLRHESSEL